MQQFFTLITFLFVFSPISVLSQTVSYTEEVGELEEQQFVDAKNCFLKQQESVSHIWKLNVADLLNTEVNFLDPIVGIETGIGIGYEQRLKTGWSLDFTLNGSILKGDLNDNQNNTLPSSSNFNLIQGRIEFSIEPRWYFKKKKQVALGLSGDNLSGPYLGLQFGLDLEKSNSSITSDPSNPLPGLEGALFGLFESDRESKITNRIFTQTLNIGLQQQFSKNGYFDIKIGAGLRRNRVKYSVLNTNGQFFPSSSETIRGIDLNYQLGLGFALGNNKKKEEISDCQVFEYHEDRKRLLKLSIVTNPNFAFIYKSFEAIFAAGIEQKIGDSPLSINANLIYLASIPFAENRWSVELEPRYYYDLKKRQRLGKTGNSFSANYVGLRSELVFDRTFGIAPVWGLQRQFFKRFLFDFAAGPERIHDFSSSTERNGWSIFSELRIGLAF